VSRPLVSVVLPVRNAAGWLPAALGSLRRQTLGDIEILAVDDGSRDASPELLETAARRDARVRPLATGGAGLVAALELGRREARAPLLARMDADDLSHPDRLRIQFAHLQGHPELAGTGCRVRIFPRQRVRRGWLRYERWLNDLCSPGAIRRERFVESPLAHPSVMLRAEALAAVGGYRPGPFPEDYDLWLRLLATGRALDKVPRVLLAWRDSDERATRQDPRYLPARHRALKLVHLLAGPLAGRREVAVWGAGESGRRWARALGPAGVRVALFLDVDPRKIGRMLEGAPVLPTGAARDPSLPFLLGAVGAEGGHAHIRATLTAAGKLEEQDFLLVE
jgi:glycosyltransferase involved in cell wall biosynthesis